VGGRTIGWRSGAKAAGGGHSQLETGRARRARLIPEYIATGGGGNWSETGGVVGLGITPIASPKMYLWKGADVVNRKRARGTELDVGVRAWFKVQYP